MVRKGKVKLAIRICLREIMDLDLNSVETNMVTSYLDEIAYETMRKIRLFKQDEDADTAKVEIREDAKQRAKKDLDTSINSKTFKVRFRKQEKQNQLGNTLDMKSNMYR